MIYIDIFGYTLETNLNLNVLNIDLNGLFIFLSNFIELNVNYSLNFKLVSEEDTIQTIHNFIRIKSLNGLNIFISKDNSTYKDVLYSINLYRNVIQNLYSIADISEINLYRHDVKDIYVYLRRY